MELVKEYVALSESEMRKNKLLEANYRECSSELFFVIDKASYEPSVRHYWNGVLKELRNNGLEVCVSGDNLWEKHLN